MYFLSKLIPFNIFIIIFSDGVVEDKWSKIISSADLNIFRTVATLISSLSAICFIKESCVIIKCSAYLQSFSEFDYDNISYFVKDNIVQYLYI